MAGVSLGSPLPAASAAEENPLPKRPRIAYLSEVKEEGDDIPAQVAMVTEEDGAPQVALITQAGAQQVQTLGVEVGWATLAGTLSHCLWGAPSSNSPTSTQFLFFSLMDLRAEAEGTKSCNTAPPSSSCFQLSLCDFWSTVSSFPLYLEDDRSRSSE